MKSTIFNIKLKIIFKIANLILIPQKYFLIFLYLIFKKKYSQGYEYFKWNKINQVINSKDKRLYINRIYNLDERVIEYKWIFNELNKFKKKLHILDAGSTLNFPQIIKKLKSRFFITIQTLYPENYSFYDDGVSYVYDDLIKKKFHKNTFDIITCISTLEHVGFDNTKYNTIKKKNSKKISKNDYLKVIQNFRFFLKYKGVLLITVPFGIHAEFNNLQVFDKKKIKKIINKFKPSKFDLKYVTYSKGIWRECSIEESLINQKKFKKNSFDLKSSQSVAFIKLVK